MVIRYRALEEREVDRQLFASFIRRQQVTLCWRKRGDRWDIQEDPFLDDWTEEDYQQLVIQLRRTIAAGGLCLGAFEEGVLKGFASVEAGLFGEKGNYLDLSNLHVSQDRRGRGIGTALFLAAGEWARRQGADRLYLSAHSAVETQRFYRKLGCVEAEYRHREHIAREPMDCQLEYRL